MEKQWGKEPKAERKPETSLLPFPFPMPILYKELADRPIH
jgi:hypothetical protein